MMLSPGISPLPSVPYRLRQDVAPCRKMFGRNVKLMANTRPWVTSNMQHIESTHTEDRVTVYSIQSLIHRRSRQLVIRLLTALLFAVAGLYSVYDTSKSELATQRLYDAIRLNDTRAAKSAISEGADCNAAEPSIALSNVSPIKALLRLFSRERHVNHATPLTIALDDFIAPGPAIVITLKYPAENVALIRALIAGGANPNIWAKSECTPLGAAVNDHKYATARVLLLAGANANAFTREDFYCPLEAAADSNDEAMCQLLLTFGADANRFSVKQLNAERQRYFYHPLSNRIINIICPGKSQLRGK